MAIISSGIWDIDPTVTDGTQLAGYLNELVKAINTNQSSATRPPMIKKGGLWTKTLSGSDIAVMVYDGTKDYEIGKIVGGDIQLDSIWTEVGDVATYDGKVVVGNASWVGGGTTGLGIQASSNSSSPFAFYIRNSDNDLITSVRCNGDTNINGKTEFAQDIKVNGVTVGKGSGNFTNSTALGAGALSSVTTAENSTAVGAGALRDVTEGKAQTAVGNSCLVRSQGEHNTGIGYAAGIALTTGTNNTLLGFQAGQTLVSGNNNICVGHQAYTSSPDVSNEVVIGNDAVTKTRLNGVLELKDGKINTKDKNLEIVVRDDVGSYTRFGIYHSTTNLCVREDGKAAMSASYVNGNYSYMAASGNEGIHKFVSDNGGVFTPKSYVNATTGMLLALNKSIKNVTPIKSALDKINKLNPVSYYSDGSYKEVGFVTQELHKVISESVDVDEEKTKKDGTPSYQGIDITRLIPYLTKAVQELSEKNKLIEKLEARLKKIEDQLKKKKK